MHGGSQALRDDADGRLDDRVPPHRAESQDRQRYGYPRDGEPARAKDSGLGDGVQQWHEPLEREHSEQRYPKLTPWNTRKHPRKARKQEHRVIDHHVRRRHDRQHDDAYPSLLGVHILTTHGSHHQQGTKSQEDRPDEEDLCWACNEWRAFPA